MATDGSAFMTGLAAADVTSVVKHFPGFGGSSRNTDYGPATTLPWSVLKTTGLVPFEMRHRASALSAVMMSNASVPGLTPLPAGISSVAVDVSSPGTRLQGSDHDRFALRGCDQRAASERSRCGGEGPAAPERTWSSSVCPAPWHLRWRSPGGVLERSCGGGRVAPSRDPRERRRAGRGHAQRRRAARDWDGASRGGASITSLIDEHRRSVDVVVAEVTKRLVGVIERVGIDRDLDADLRRQREEFLPSMRVFAVTLRRVRSWNRCRS